MDPAVVFSPGWTSPASVASPQRADSPAPDQHAVLPPNAPVFVSVFSLLGPPKAECRNLNVVSQAVGDLPWSTAYVPITAAWVALDFP